MNNAISFVFDQLNDTNNDTFMDIKRSLNTNLLPKDVANTYSLSITKLDVPTSKIEQLYFEDRSKYSTVLSYYDHTGNKYEDYSSEMPSFVSHGIKYYTKEQVLEYLNRCLCNNFNQYLDALSDTNAKFNASFVSTLTNASSLSSNLTCGTSYTKLAGLKLNINSIIRNSGSTGQIIKLFVQSPDGQKNILFVGLMSDLLQYQNFEINDFSYNDWNNVSSSTISSTGVKSYESYRKLKTATCAGNWKVGLEGSTSFSIELNASLTLYFSDNEFIPTLPLFISHSNDALRLNVQGYYLSNNIKVGFSPLLFNSLGFTYVSKMIGNYVFLQYDTTIIPPSLDPAQTLEDIIQFTQEMNSLNALCNLKEIQLRSSSFSSVGENIITNASTPIGNNVLVEFIVNKDESIGNFLLYSISQVPWRKLDVSTLVGNLRNVDFQVFASYENGLQKHLQLSPGESWSVRLSFIRGN